MTLLLYDQKYIIRRHGFIQYLPREGAHFPKITSPSPQHSPTTSTIVMNSSAPHKIKQHLFDIDIAKILALDKVSIPQRKIMSFIKCIRKAIRNMLSNYMFEIFQEHNLRREY